MTTITCLVENTAATEALRSEHGLSLLIRHGGATVLLDTGQSAAFLDNARDMGVDLSKVTHVALSHGHYDHSGGLAAALEHLDALGAAPELVMHPDVLARRSLPQDPGQSNPLGLPKDLGMPEASRKALEGRDTRFSREPVELAPGLIFLGEIPRTDPSACRLLGKIERNGGEEDDGILDDSGLALVTPNGLVVVTGCAHSGVINTAEHARRVTGVREILAVVGGLHLKGAGADLLAGNEAWLRANARRVHDCHCTGDALRGLGLGEGLKAGDHLEF